MVSLDFFVGVPDFGHVVDRRLNVYLFKHYIGTFVTVQFADFAFRIVQVSEYNCVSRARQ